MNPLSDVLTPAWRQRLYLLVAVLGLAASVGTIWGLDDPRITATVGLLSTAIGATAASNVKRERGEHRADG